MQTGPKPQGPTSNAHTHTNQTQAPALKETPQTPAQASDWKPRFYSCGNEETVRHWWGCPGGNNQENRDRQRNRQITQPNFIFRQIFREISICAFLKWARVQWKSVVNNKPLIIHERVFFFQGVKRDALTTLCPQLYKTWHVTFYVEQKKNGLVTLKCEKNSGDE